MKKFSLTKNKKETCFGTLFQIKAEMSFGDVKKGDLGGWVSKEENLSQKDNAWVSGNALVCGDARVYGNAWVSGDARVYGDAQVSGNAWVYGDARVYGKLKISAGYFFGTRYQKEEIKYKELDENYELIYKGEAKFEEEDEVAKAIKLLEEKGKLKDGKILI